MTEAQEIAGGIIARRAGSDKAILQVKTMQDARAIASEELPGESTHVVETVEPIWSSTTSRRTSRRTWSDAAMDRTEHLAWCKRRALEYLDAGDHEQAVKSMLSDLGKHDETRAMVRDFAMILGVDALLLGGEREAREFIEGFR